MMSDGGAAAEAGGSPKLGDRDQFRSPQAGAAFQLQMVDGDGVIWWLDVDDGQLGD